MDSDGCIIKPVTIGFLLLVYTICLFIAEPTIYFCMLLTASITLFVINKKKLTKAIVGFFLILALAYVINESCAITGWIGSIYTMLLIVLKIYPVSLLAISLSNYSTSTLLNSLRSIGLPNNLAIAVAVFFRFLPDYKAYMRDIKESLLVRNISFKWTRPLESFELYLVPMIYKAFQTGEVLTCSLIAKGIEYKCKKTSYDNIKLTLNDYLIMLFGLCIMAVSIWQKF